MVIPPGSREFPEFTFVKFRLSRDWHPALLERWWRLPDGTWACRLRIPRHRDLDGRRATDTMTMRYDPNRIRTLTMADLNPDSEAADQQRRRTTDG